MEVVAPEHATSRELRFLFFTLAISATNLMKVKVVPEVGNYISLTRKLTQPLNNSNSDCVWE